MNPKTLTALQGSIDKWRRIEAGEIADLGTMNCPLCEVFVDNDCAGCPVAEKTGHPFCLDSPYEAWESEQRERNNRVESRFANTTYLVVLARAEREFLESLLPEETK